MSKKISIPVFLVITALLMVMTFMVTYLSVTEAYRSQIADENANNTVENWENKLDYVNKLTQMYFLNEISSEALEDYLPAAYIAALGDKYTYYMTKEEYEAFSSDLNSDMEGIGVNIVYNSEVGAMDVISVVNGSPAMEKGVESGDLIYKVEGQTVAEIGYYEALNVMLGKAGTVANFSVWRMVEGEYQSIDFSIERGYIIQETVTGKMINENIGFIRLDEFDKKTPEQFKSIFESLVDEGADKFIFDLRYNPGGDLDAITEILDYLLPEGPIIRIFNRYGEVSSIESDAECVDYPFVVLTNGNTASAAELFSSALRDYKKAVLVGETTYGKGTMQSILPLPDGSAVCMTTQTYCPPYSESYNGIGIVPDVEVVLPEELSNVNIYKITLEQDTQLQAAIEQFNK